MTTVTPVEDYRRRRLARHGAFAALALLLLAFLIFEVIKHGGYGWALLGLFGPNVALLFPATGRAARQLHTALHLFWGPVVLMALASFELVGLGFFIAGLGWAAHLALDRARERGLR
jgi:hypothetical protein